MTHINCFTGRELQGLPDAEVLKVGPLRRYYWQDHWSGSRDVTIRCPYCDATHRHGWLEGEPEPGNRVAHCIDAPLPGGYHIPAPGPHVPIPGLCERPTKAGTRCTRPVRHTGQPCHLHQES